MGGVVIKKSKISGKGIFADRDFKKGEVVLEWHPKILTKSEGDTLRSDDRHYLYQMGKKYLFMQSPERYVNHSCEPNTRVKNYSDIAIKDIKKGEEITSDYSNGQPMGFKCNCGSNICKGFIGK
ncbi:MAG: SET domain-containing protein [Candidatus Spechtbacteria bacterium]|nr:SET domain-containing protein [Candidatus Spechtbacteria bacterium]